MLLFHALVFCMSIFLPKRERGERAVTAQFPTATHRVTSPSCAQIVDLGPAQEAQFLQLLPARTSKLRKRGNRASGFMQPHRR